MKLGVGALAALAILAASGSSSAQAPTLNRNYAVDAAEDIDWRQPRVLAGFRFVATEERRSTCKSGLHFEFERLDRKPTDWNGRDPALDKALVELGKLVGEDCPGLNSFSFAPGPRQGFANVLRGNGWHLNLIAADMMRTWQDRRDRYNQTPTFPADGPNPLADRGFYASRLVATDREFSLYQAFARRGDYTRNGMGVSLVLIHDIGPADHIATLMADERTGQLQYAGDLVARINTLLLAADSPFLPESAGVIDHYVSCFHAPERPGGPPYDGAPEQPILRSIFNLTTSGVDLPSRIISVKPFPTWATGGGQTSRQYPAISKFNEFNTSMTLDMLFSEACK